LITPFPTFRPAGLPLSRSQVNLTNYLNHAWNNRDASLATTFAYLSQLEQATQYRQILATITAQPHTIQLQNLINSTPLLLTAAIDCPSDLATTILRSETGCLWARIA